MRHLKLKLFIGIFLLITVLFFLSGSLLDQEAQDEMYKQSVLPDTIKKRIAVEAGHPMSWYKYLGEQGIMIGLDHFGASAPASTLFQKYGFSVKNIIKKIREHYYDNSNTSAN